MSDSQWFGFFIGLPVGAICAMVGVFWYFLDKGAS